MQSEKLKVLYTTVTYVLHVCCQNNSKIKYQNCRKRQNRYS